MQHSVSQYSMLIKQTCHCTMKTKRYDNFFIMQYSKWTVNKNFVIFSHFISLCSTLHSFFCHCYNECLQYMDKSMWLPQKECNTDQDIIAGLPYLHISCHQLHLKLVGPYRISLSNCSAFNVPSMLWQSLLNTLYALISFWCFGPVLVLKYTPSRADNRK